MENLTRNTRKQNFLISLLLNIAFAFNILWLLEKLFFYIEENKLRELFFSEIEKKDSVSKLLQKFFSQDAENKGIKINLSELSPKNRKFPLYIACENGNLELANFLVEKGANINQFTENGYLFDVALEKRYKPEITSYLRERGAKRDPLKKILSGDNNLTEDEKVISDFFLGVYLYRVTKVILLLEPFEILQIKNEDIKKMIHEIKDSIFRMPRELEVYALLKTRDDCNKLKELIISAATFIQKNPDSAKILLKNHFQSELEQDFNELRSINLEEKKSLEITELIKRTKTKKAISPPHSNNRQPNSTLLLTIFNCTKLFFTSLMPSYNNESE